jgi:hypothetical protein
MADVERIAPPVPTLPPPVGRSVGKRRKQREPRPTTQPHKPAGGEPPRDHPPEHIDEYV